MNLLNDFNIGTHVISLRFNEKGIIIDDNSLFDSHYLVKIYEKSKSWHHLSDMKIDREYYREEAIKKILD